MEQERLPFELLEGWRDIIGLVPAEEARPRIQAMRAQGLDSKRIAHRLNMDGVITPSGRGRWHAETVTRHEDPARWAAYMRDYRRAKRTG